jgi:hypothetical protein
MYIIDAILAINSDAKVTVSGKNIDSCQIEWLENTSPISKEDIKSKMQELKDVDAEKENKKASGKQKLKDLGLDDDEIKALMGA